MMLRRAFSFSDLVLIALLASTWAAFLVMKQSRSEASELLAKRVYPPTIHGFRLNLDNHSEQLYAWAPQEPTPARRATLILATDDNCPVCQATYPAWASLISQSRWSAGVQATVITFYGDVIATRLSNLLRSQNVAHRVLRVRDNHVFGVVTGIKAVPFTALVDESDRVRLLAVELNEPAIREFSQAIAGKLPEPIANYLSVLQVQGKEIR